jgi:hypothetical protein
MVKPNKSNRPPARTLLRLLSPAPTGISKNGTPYATVLQLTVPKTTITEVTIDTGLDQRVIESGSQVLYAESVIGNRSALGQPGTAYHTRNESRE